MLTALTDGKLVTSNISILTRRELHGDVDAPDGHNQAHNLPAANRHTELSANNAQATTASDGKQWRAKQPSQ